MVVLEDEVVDALLLKPARAFNWIPCDTPKHLMVRYSLPTFTVTVL